MNKVERIADGVVDAAFRAVICVATIALSIFGVAAVVAPVVILGPELPGMLLSAALLGGYLFAVAEEGLEINPNHRFTSFVVGAPLAGSLGALFMVGFLAIVGLPAVALGWSALGIAISVALGLFLIGLMVRPIAEAIEEAALLLFFALPVLLLAVGLIALWITVL